ncbi:hypothetical protein BVRB_8g187650 [Beta vulgaris subsp. vulgaris]|nr:hypothetical protein BVRB_8g187650 [Beta vulgaris subsp. vulgaris]
MWVSDGGLLVAAVRGGDGDGNSDDRKVSGQEAMDRIMRAIVNMKKSLREEIAIQGAQLEKKTGELSYTFIASNSEKQRQNDLDSVATQLGMEDPIHENGEDVKSTTS